MECRRSLNGHNHDGNYAEKDGVHYLAFQAMVNTEEIERKTSD